MKNTEIGRIYAAACLAVMKKDSAVTEQDRVAVGRFWKHVGLVGAANLAQMDRFETELASSVARTKKEREKSGQARILGLLPQVPIILTGFIKGKNIEEEHKATICELIARLEALAEGKSPFYAASATIQTKPSGKQKARPRRRTA